MSSATAPIYLFLDLTHQHHSVVWKLGHGHLSRWSAAAKRPQQQPQSQQQRRDRIDTIVRGHSIVRSALDAPFEGGGPPSLAALLELRQTAPVTNRVDDTDAVFVQKLVIDE
jgi:hypothetical protein